MPDVLMFLGSGFEDLEAVTGSENRRLIHTAHASIYHWLIAGTAVHEQRGEWLIPHVYSALVLGEPALRHGWYCENLTDEHSDTMEDFDCAYACEGLARASAVLGETKVAKQHKAEARKLGDLIRDSESRKIFDGGFYGGDWHGVP